MTGFDWIIASLYVAAAAWAASVLIALIDRVFHPPLRPVTSDKLQETPRVVVIIPARNEEENLQNCIPSVLAQDYPNLRMIVVDDQSTDGTADVVRKYAEEDDRLELLSGADMPPGWVGKGWAVYQGHQASEGDWVLLLDADTDLRPHAVSTAVDFALRNNYDFLNPTPLFINRSFWEKMMQPLLWSLVTLRFPAFLVNTQWVPENMAFGPFLLIRKSAYDAVEGHKQVCNDILEDVALSRLIKSEGYRTYVVAGYEIFSIRMYDSFAALLEGWIKTAYGAMNYSLFWMALAVIGMFYLALFPFLTAAAALAAPASWLTPEQSSQLLVASHLAIGSLFARRVVDGLRFRMSFWSLVLHPLAMFVVQYMQVAATWKYYFSSITWKGRAYYADKENGGLHA